MKNGERGQRKMLPLFGYNYTGMKTKLFEGKKRKETARKNDNFSNGRVKKRGKKIEHRVFYVHAKYKKDIKKYF